MLFSRIVTLVALGFANLSLAESEGDSELETGSLTTETGSHMHSPPLETPPPETTPAGTPPAGTTPATTPPAESPSATDSETAVQTATRTCGFRQDPCPTDQACKPNFARCWIPSRCTGKCVYRNRYRQCGSSNPRAPRCVRPNYECRTDPRTPSGSSICLPKKLATCGGITGKKCPRGLFCYDDPSDNCNPASGGADCPGVCV
ncbi:hypothetical protein DCS_04183 [Drechmeria coniospora]|uniref:Uncharacterized protein n=1 Tax=Drechmeria coniospora TaxID=98403 RepID=A0A151GJB2_DRECN|nr:hypothetical protein DCS_04183 [Drechmeria coniospora]KYK57176.1 hypothetical protein DCS_04183 [Drechmeria coniospora]